MLFSKITSSPMWHRTIKKSKLKHIVTVVGTNETSCKHCISYV
jgi:hypothetical protein